MRLLIITQAVDKNDPVLGFFHRWIEEFAKNFESLVVICLKKGGYNLPENVKVLSLGKEEGVSKAEYISRFYRYVWQERGNYDAVFVHMNQEYILLGGLIWKMLGKKAFLWRNHAKGSFLTRIAVWLSNKVFYTSPSSFTACFKKAVQMPVGIDTDFFKPDLSVNRIPNSILFLGRIAPVKKVLEFVDWLRSQDFTKATIAGGSLPSDREYEQQAHNRVHEYGLDSKVEFIGAILHEEARKLMQSYETYVNFTPAGSLDKTIFEAAACGASIIVENTDLKILEKKNSEELREYVVENHSLEKLMDKLAILMS